MNIDLNYIMSSLSSQQLYNCWMHQTTGVWCQILQNRGVIYRLSVLITK